MCRWSEQVWAWTAGVGDVHLHCRQGVAGAPLRESCPVYMREAGADDDVMPRHPGRWQIVGVAF
jgi:hypothetical protein